MAVIDYEDIGFGCYNIGPGSRVEIRDDDRVYYYVVLREGSCRFQLSDFTLTTPYRFKSLLDATAAAMRRGGEVWESELHGRWYIPSESTRTMLADYKRGSKNG